MWKKLKNKFICWFSENFYDIHSHADFINKIPDKFGELQCKRCRKIFKV